MRLDAFQPHQLKHIVFQMRFTAEDLARLPSPMQARMHAMLKHYRGMRVGQGDDHAAEALEVLAEAVRGVREAGVIPR